MDIATAANADLPEKREPCLAGTNYGKGSSKVLPGKWLADGDRISR